MRSHLRVPRPGQRPDGRRPGDDGDDEGGSERGGDGAPEVPPGRLIVLEGIDGTGKSHVSGRIVDHLGSRGVAAIFTSEPTSGAAGRMLKRSANHRMDAYEELFLFLADRAEHTRWIAARLHEGNWVVCDRYAMSSAAYQGTALEERWEVRGQDPVTWIMEIQRPWLLVPDLTLLIVDDIGRCLSRVAGRGRPTKFERAAYLERVQRNYVRLSEVMDGVAVVEEPELERLVEAVLGRIETVIGNSHID
jgi:dTMP kinase